MDAQTTTSIVTGIAGSASGGLAVGWLSKLLITRFLKDNDEKHKKNESRNDKTDEALDKINETLSAMNKELGVISGALAQVTVLKEQVHKDHDSVIELRAWNGKYHDDLKAQFGKIRTLEENLSDIGNIISSLRRSASGE